ALGGELLAVQNGVQMTIALAIFSTSAVVAVASISNDNLQDLKTGWLVGATPWRQQVALLIGCVVGAAVISPVLELLYNAYGFADAMP
ncbi:OPT/YSL family transporter, partial [Campylobacter jejuni]